MLRQLPDSSSLLGGESREEIARKPELICMWMYDPHPRFRNRLLTTSQSFLYQWLSRRVKGIQYPQLWSMVQLGEDRNKLVRVEIPGSDKGQAMLCRPLGVEKAWISAGLLFGSEFTDILHHLLDHSLTEGTRELHKPYFLSLFPSQI